MKIQQVLLFTNQLPIGCQILFLIFITHSFLSLHNWYKLDLGEAQLARLFGLL
jgi:hypothetical protein